MRLGTAAPFLVSAIIHAAIFAFILSAPVKDGHSALVKVEITETQKPQPEVKPPPPPPEPEPKAAPAPPTRRASAPPVVRQPPAPPPPNSPPPEDAPPPDKAPIRIGISMSSTVESGAVAAPVGNTLYGKAPDQAPDPASVQPYRSPRYAPPSELTTLPEKISCQMPKDEYPEEARRLGFEGSVRLRLHVDEEGRVTRATVLEDPGHGLGEAAARALPRHCRFRPARRGDQPVATDIPYTVHFELP